MKRKDSQRVFEISMAALTGIGKFIFMDWLDLKLPFIIGVIIFWSLYIFSRSKNEKGILKHWGFRTDNFNSVLKLILPYAIFSIALFFLIGYFQGSLNLKWYILILCILYPIWGVFQHYLTMSLVAGNLSECKSGKLHKSIPIFCSSLLFGLIHYPDKWLMIGTFILALFYAFIFLKNRNLYVLGIFHGILGALFYYTVVNRDPFLEVFGS